MTKLIQIINARLVEDDKLVSESLWFDSETGLFVSPPSPALPASVIDLQNRIVSPGFLDLQINGAYGFDFSEDSTDVDGYKDRFLDARRKLIATGTTSFLPTMTSQFPERYHQVSIRILRNNCSYITTREMHGNNNFFRTYLSSGRHNLAIPWMAVNHSAPIARVLSSPITAWASIYHRRYMPPEQPATRK